MGLVQKGKGWMALELCEGWSMQQVPEQDTKVLSAFNGQG